MAYFYLRINARNRFICILTLPQFKEEWNTMKIVREMTRNIRDREMPTTFRMLIASWNVISGKQGL